jgi:hypothetical protein
VREQVSVDTQRTRGGYVLSGVVFEDRFFWCCAKFVQYVEKVLWERFSCAYVGRKEIELMEPNEEKYFFIWSM